MPAGVVTRASIASASKTVVCCQSLRGSMGDSVDQKLKLFNDSGISDCITLASYSA